MSAPILSQLPTLTSILTQGLGKIKALVTLAFSLAFSRSPDRGSHLQLLLI